MEKQKESLAAASTTLPVPIPVSNPSVPVSVPMSVPVSVPVSIPVSAPIPIPMNVEKKGIIPIVFDEEPKKGIKKVIGKKRI